MLKCESRTRGVIAKSCLCLWLSQVKPFPRLPPVILPQLSQLHLLQQKYERFLPCGTGWGSCSYPIYTIWSDFFFSPSSVTPILLVHSDIMFFSCTYYEVLCMIAWKAHPFSLKHHTLHNTCISKESNFTVKSMCFIICSTWCIYSIVKRCPLFATLCYISHEVTLTFMWLLYWIFLCPHNLLETYMFFLLQVQKELGSHIAAFITAHREVWKKQ